MIPPGWRHEVTTTAVGTEVPDVQQSFCFSWSTIVMPKQFCDAAVSSALVIDDKLTEAPLYPSIGSKAHFNFLIQLHEIMHSPEARAKLLDSGAGSGGSGAGSGAVTRRAALPPRKRSLLPEADGGDGGGEYGRAAFPHPPLAPLAPVWRSALHRSDRPAWSICRSESSQGNYFLPPPAAHHNLSLKQLEPGYKIIWTTSPPRDQA